MADGQIEIETERMECANKQIKPNVQEMAGVQISHDDHNPATCWQAYVLGLQMLISEPEEYRNLSRRESVLSLGTHLEQILKTNN
jgi:hypothetical protein